MIVYAESSAVLSWLLHEAEGAAVLRSLRRAELVLSSDLTFVECDRALLRAVRERRLGEAEAKDRVAGLTQVAASWNILRVSEAIIERARRPFPVEPVRTLDALHLASALVARGAIPELEVLALDHRVRDVAKSLGFGVLPKSAA